MYGFFLCSKLNFFKAGDGRCFIFNEDLASALATDVQPSCNGNVRGYAWAPLPLLAVQFFF